MQFIKILARLPVDLGQGNFKHKTKGKLIGFKRIPRATYETTALDLGCGDGYWSEKLKNLGYRTTSIDMKRKYPNEDADYPYKNAVFADANSVLPFPDRYFDIIWCSEVIEHIENYKLTIQEIQRVLKPGGLYIITTPNSFFWLHYFLWCFGFTHKNWQNSGHKNFFSLKDAKGLFPGANVYGYFPYMFIKAEIQHLIGFLSPTLIIIGKKTAINLP